MVISANLEQLDDSRHEFWNSAKTFERSWRKVKWLTGHGYDADAKYQASHMSLKAPDQELLSLTGIRKGVLFQQELDFEEEVFKSKKPTTLYPYERAIGSVIFPVFIGHDVQLQMTHQGVAVETARRLHLEPNPILIASGNFVLSLMEIPSGSADLRIAA